MDDTTRREEGSAPAPQGGGTQNTAEYSASKAPETRAAATDAEPGGDPRLLPGGAHRAAAEIGMSEMNREDVPSEAVRTGLVHYGDTQDGDPV